MIKGPKDVGAAGPREVRAAREAEEARKKYDPSYISFAEYDKLPDAAKRDPVIASRARYSRPDWPENRMAMAEVQGRDLPTDTGRPVDRRDVDGAEFFAKTQGNGPKREDA